MPLQVGDEIEGRVVKQRFNHCRRHEALSLADPAEQGQCVGAWRPTLRGRPEGFEVRYVSRRREIAPALHRSQK